ncbi:MAG: hypothetical protein SWE60_09600 [Thermodesulfobacteriota bacterium]|nr:hypothetical protein [Thermodesulfobacteriota bacterium]
MSTVTDSDERELAEYTSYEPTGKMGQVDYGNNTTTVHTYDPYSTKLTGIVTSNGSGNKPMGSGLLLTLNLWGQVCS